jgi:hypothetical protein
MDAHIHMCTMCVYISILILKKIYLYIFIYTCKKIRIKFE